MVVYAPHLEKLEFVLTDVEFFGSTAPTFVVELISAESDVSLTQEKTVDIVARPSLTSKIPFPSPLEVPAYAPPDDLSTRIKVISEVEGEWRFRWRWEYKWSWIPGKQVTEWRSLILQIPACPEYQEQTRLTPSSPPSPRRL